jgi:hypothetical protein
MFARIFLLLLGLGVLCLLPLAAMAAVHVVSSSGELAAAVGAAAEGDIIELADGSYHWVDGVQISRGMTLRSQSGSAADAIVYLDYLTHGIVATESFSGEVAVRFEGLTFKQFDGEGSFIGHNGDLELVGCVLEDNHTELALIVANAGLLLDHCQIQLCSGDAIAVGSGATVVRDCVITENQSLFAILDQEFGSLEVQRSALVDNTGRLIYAAPISVVLDQVEATGNSGAGAAIHLAFQPELQMSHCTVRDNTYSEGGLYLGPLPEASIYQCDIVDNGVYDGRIVAGTEVVFQCCEVIPEQWSILSGSLTLDNADCGVGTQTVTLDGLKAQYR